MSSKEGVSGKESVLTNSHTTTYFQLNINSTWPYREKGRKEKERKSMPLMRHKVELEFVCGEISLVCTLQKATCVVLMRWILFCCRMTRHNKTKLTMYYVL